MRKERKRERARERERERENKRDSPDGFLFYHHYLCKHGFAMLD